MDELCDMAVNVARTFDLPKPSFFNGAQLLAATSTFYVAKDAVLYNCSSDTAGCCFTTAALIQLVVAI